MTRSELRNVGARLVVAALLHDGFVHVRTVGSHRVYRHTDGRRVVLWFHASGDTFGRKTFAKILRQTRWTERDLLRLGLTSTTSSSLPSSSP